MTCNLFPSYKEHAFVKYRSGDSLTGPPQEAQYKTWQRIGVLLLAINVTNDLRYESNSTTGREKEPTKQR